MHKLKTKFQIPPMLGEVKNDDKSNRSQMNMESLWIKLQHLTMHQCTEKLKIWNQKLYFLLWVNAFNFIREHNISILRASN